MTSMNHNRQSALAKSRPDTPKRVSFAEEPAPRTSHRKRHSSTIVEHDDHVPLALLAYKRGYPHHSSPALMTTKSFASMDQQLFPTSRSYSSITISSDSRDTYQLPPIRHSMRSEYQTNRRYHHHTHQQKRPHRYSLPATESEKVKRKQRPKSYPSQPTFVDSKRKKLSVNEIKQTPVNLSPLEISPVSPKKKTLLNSNWFVVSLRKLIAK